MSEHANDRANRTAVSPPSERSSDDTQDVGASSTWTRVLQRRIAQRAIQRRAAPAAPTAAAAAERGIDGASTSLPHGDAIQRSFGRHDVSGVQAHVGGAAGEAAGELGAAAFATGNHVAFADAPGLHTAAHEAAHVIQQRSGRVPGGVGAVGDAHEQHADAVADRVVRGESAEALLDQYAGGGGDKGSEGSLQLLAKKGAPIDITKLTADECKEHLARIGRKTAKHETGDDADYTYDPADKAAIQGRAKALQKEQAEAAMVKLTGLVEGKLASLATASDWTHAPPWASVTPTPPGEEGSETAGANVAPDVDAIVAEWQTFLGPGPYSHKHPRTGAVDATRLVSADGQRSIRYGNHEKRKNLPDQHHFHKETWSYDGTAKKVMVANVFHRAPVKG